MKAARQPIIVRPVTQYNASINVTPLVDVVLVLLIIFMVVTPLLERDLPLALPESKPVQAIEPATGDQIIVTLTNDGVRVNGKQTPQELYVSEVRRLLTHTPIGKRVVFFVAGDEVGYEHLVTALDGAKLAGAEVLGMTDSVQPSGARTPGKMPGRDVGAE